jgi:hypothetical protein
MERAAIVSWGTELVSRVDMLVTSGLYLNIANSR